MACQQLRLDFGNLAELFFKRVGDASMKIAARLPQQCAISCVLHECVLEQVSRVRRHTLAEQQTRREAAVRSQIEALPHQTRAVYGEVLTRLALGFCSRM